MTKRARLQTKLLLGAAAATAALGLVISASAASAPGGFLAPVTYNMCQALESKIGDSLLSKLARFKIVAHEDDEAVGTGGNTKFPGFCLFYGAPRNYGGQTGQAEPQLGFFHNTGIDPQGLSPTADFQQGGCDNGSQAFPLTAPGRGKINLADWAPDEHRGDLCLLWPGVYTQVFVDFSLQTKKSQVRAALTALYKRLGRTTP
jgi:hypothetical protein